MDPLKFLVVCFFLAVLILGIVTLSLSGKKKQKSLPKPKEQRKEVPKKTPIISESIPISTPVQKKEIEKLPVENLRKETVEIQTKEEEEKEFVPLVLDVPSLEQNTWTYLSEGTHFQVTSNEGMSEGVVSYTHLKMGGTFHFEKVEFGGRTYGVPKMEKVLLVTTFSLKVDPSYAYYMYVVKEDRGFRILINDYDKFISGTGREDLRRGMELMAVKFGRMNKRRLINLTALANYEFENSEIQVSRKVLNENYAKLIHKKELGVIEGEGFTAFDKEQKGIEPKYIFTSFTVYYPLDMAMPLIAEFPQGTNKKYYRNQSFNTWNEVKIGDLEDELDYTYHDLKTRSRLRIYLTLFTAKDEIPLETRPNIEERVYEFKLMDKIRTSPTSFLFVFEYPEKVKDSMKLPIFYPFVLIGTRDVPTSAGLWNRLKLKEATREVKRMYTPLYIDVERRNVYFLIRILKQCDMFPDGGRLTRYLDEAQIKETIKNSVANSRIQLVKDNKLRVDDEYLEFESLNLLAKGVGIVPFVRILSYYKEKPMDLRLIFVNQNYDELILKPMFDQLAKDNPRLKIQYLLLDEEGEDAINSPLTEEIAEEHLKNNEKTISLICGNPTFCSESTKILERLNMKKVYCI